MPDDDSRTRVDFPIGDHLTEQQVAEAIAGQVRIERSPYGTARDGAAARAMTASLARRTGRGVPPGGIRPRHRT